ncbi:hypothetical protein AVEN_205794-1, partial [Araneus ventricosus]
MRINVKRLNQSDLALTTLCRALLPPPYSPHYGRYMGRPLRQ